MASRMMLWAAFGRPNQREWVPSGGEREAYAKNDGIYPSGYRLITARASAPAAVEKSTTTAGAESSESFSSNRLWKGWVLPASDADIWFAAGSAAYYQDLESRNVGRAIRVRWAEYRSASIAPANPLQHFRMETAKGALFLDNLRQRMGNDRFFELMDDFFAAHTTQAVTAKTFLEAAGVEFKMPEDPGGPAYLASDIRSRLSSALLVYGTLKDAGANRYAAEQLQKGFLDWNESAVPMRKDFEVTEAELRAHDVIFVGRPESNSALAAWKEKIGLEAEGAMFRVRGTTHASAGEGLIYAAVNPLEPSRMVLVLEGNDALSMALMTKAGLPRAEYAVVDSGEQASSGFLK